MGRKKQESEDQPVGVVPIDLDAIQGPPPGPQDEFDGWCVVQDGEWSVQAAQM